MKLATLSAATAGHANEERSAPAIAARQKRHDLGR
jgi:hypothetical protein